MKFRVIKTKILIIDFTFTVFHVVCFSFNQMIAHVLVFYYLHFPLFTIDTSHFWSVIIQVSFCFVGANLEITINFIIDIAWKNHI